MHECRSFALLLCLRTFASLAQIRIPLGRHRIESTTDLLPFPHSPPSVSERHRLGTCEVAWCASLGELRAQLLMIIFTVHYILIILVYIK